MRPKLRWMEYVEFVLRNTGTKRWRTRDLDRTERASVVWKAEDKLLKVSKAKQEK